MRVRSGLELDQCETSFTHFKYNNPLWHVPMASDVLEVADLAAYDRYEPTIEEEAEDDDMVRDFTNNVHTTLDSSRDRISNVSVVIGSHTL